MITTRIKALTKLVELQDGLDNITASSKGITHEVSMRYNQLVYDIRRNISYNLDIAHVRGVHDKVLGYVDTKRIERFIQDNLN